MRIDAPDEGLTMRAGTIGLITWSSGLTVNVEVVAASHNVVAWLEDGVVAVATSVCGCC